MGGGGGVISVDYYRVGSVVPCGGCGLDGRGVCHLERAEMGRLDREVRVGRRRVLTCAMRRPAAWDAWGREAMAPSMAGLQNALQTVQRTAVRR